MSQYHDFEARVLGEPTSQPAHDEPAPHTLAKALHHAGTTAGVTRILRALNTQPPLRNTP